MNRKIDMNESAIHLHGDSEAIDKVRTGEITFITLEINALMNGQKGTQAPCCPTAWQQSWMHDGMSVCQRNEGSDKVEWQLVAASVVKEKEFSIKS